MYGLREWNQENTEPGFRLDCESFCGISSENICRRKLFVIIKEKIICGFFVWLHLIDFKTPMYWILCKISILRLCGLRLWWQRFKHSWGVSATQPTACSSRSSKILERMRRRSGTVMMRTKGNAREASVDFTTHRATMHASWIMVNMFIRHVFTWRLKG